VALRTGWKLISVIALILAITAQKVIAQEPQHLSRIELRRLIKNARNPADYQKLSLYFHYQAQVYRAKANLEMHDYAKFFSIYHPKFPTGADTAARLYEYYSAKADKEAKMAGHYDELLIRSGAKPISEPQVVSLTNLENQRPKEPATSVLPLKTQAAHESSTPREKQ
jgi:hypothetical protein